MDHLLWTQVIQPGASQRCLYAPWGSPCVSGQCARCPSCLMLVWRSIAGAHEGRGTPNSWGLRSRLSTDLSEMKRTDNSWDFTSFLLGEHSVLNYSWQPQQPPHLALSGLNLTAFRMGNNTPSLSPCHLGHTSKAASFVRSSKEQEQYRGNSFGLRDFSAHLAKNDPIVLLTPKPILPSLWNELWNRKSKGEANSFISWPYTWYTANSWVDLSRLLQCSAPKCPGEMQHRTAESPRTAVTLRWGASNETTRALQVHWRWHCTAILLNALRAGRTDVHSSCQTKHSHTLEILFLQCYRFLPVRQHREREMRPRMRQSSSEGDLSCFSSWHSGISFPACKYHHSTGCLRPSLGFYWASAKITGLNLNLGKDHLFASPKSISHVVSFWIFLFFFSFTAN